MSSSGLQQADDDHDDCKINTVLYVVFHYYFITYVGENLGTQIQTLITRTITDNDPICKIIILIYDIVTLRLYIRIICCFY